MKENNRGRIVCLSIENGSLECKIISIKEGHWRVYCTPTSLASISYGEGVPIRRDEAQVIKLLPLWLYSPQASYQLHPGSLCWHSSGKRTCWSTNIGSWSTGITHLNVNQWSSLWLQIRISWKVLTIFQDHSRPIKSELCLSISILYVTLMALRVKKRCHN